jgi:ribosomal protein S18 acetylase RimI-like enzyme
MVYIWSVLHTPSHDSSTRYNPDYHLIRYSISSFFLLFPQKTLPNAGFFVFPSKTGTMEAMKIRLRRAIYEDAPEIHPTFFPHESWLDFHSRFFHWISGQVENRIVYLLAEQDGVLVGQGQLHFYRRDRAEIANVCVAAAYQRQGIGTTIINHLFQEAQTRPCQKIELCVAENNHAAQALYRQLGFVVVGSIVTLQDGLALVMAKQLAS